MDKCLVSVVIPTHNRKELLIKTIKSVQNQTIKDIEIIVCDDGSEDGTKDAVLNIATCDERVKYLYCGKNGRPAVPRNIGISNAKGEWIAFTDDDDYWIPVKLERQLDALNRNSSKACCSNAFKYRLDIEKTILYFDSSKDTEYCFNQIIKCNPILCSSTIISASLISKVIGFPEPVELRAIEDYGLWLRVSCLTDFIYISEPLIYYLDVSSTSIRSKEPIKVNVQQDRVFNDFRMWGDSLQDEDKLLFDKKNKELTRYIRIRNIKLGIKDKLRPVKHRLESLISH